MNFEHKPDFLWMPVRTKPRREKKVLEYCNAHEIPCYLPLNKRIHRYERRTVEFFIPMFSGYVFCSLNEEYYQKLLRSNAVLFRINISDKQEAGLLDELRSVKAFEEISMSSDIIVKPELAEGASVTVAEGPMKGMSGIIERRKGKTVISVNIEILGQSVSAEFDAGDLEPEES